MTVLPFGRVGAQLMRLRVRRFKVTATLRYLQIMSAYRSDWLGSKGISHGATHSRAELVPRRFATAAYDRFVWLGFGTRWSAREGVLAQVSGGLG